MAISRFSTSSVAQGLPKYQKVWDGTSVYVPPAYESIATVLVGSGGSSTITLSSIPGTYKDLRLITNLRVSGPPGASTYNGWATFNGDTGSNYSSHYMQNYGGTSYVGGGANQTNLNGAFAYSTTDATSAISPSVVDIIDYSNTNKFKTIKVINGGNWSSTGFINFQSANWRSTSAVTSITISPNTGFGAYNFAENSIVSLYGIKG